MAVGTWSGIYEAYKDRKDKREQRELLMGELSEKRKAALIPLLLDRIKDQREYQSKVKMAAGWFSNRLEGVEPERKKAMLGVVAENPDWALAVVDRVEKREEVEKGRVRFAGETLIEASNAFALDRREGETEEDVVARLSSYDPEVDGDNEVLQPLVDKIMSDEPMGSEDFMSAQMTLGSTGGVGGSAVLPDFNQSSSPMDVQDYSARQDAVVEQARIEANRRRSELSQKQEDLSKVGQTLSEKESDELKNLSRAEVAYNTDKNVQPLLDLYGSQAEQALPPDARQQTPLVQPPAPVTPEVDQPTEGPVVAPKVFRYNPETQQFE